MDEAKKAAMAAGRAKAKAEKQAQEERIAALEALVAKLSAAPKVEPLRHPPLISYKGWVQAKQDCYINGFYHVGADPSKGIRASVFEVEMRALWSDDPFEAVIITGYREDGSPITEPNPDAPTPINARFRPKTSDVLANGIQANAY